jgi:glycogen(starch) synthase
LKILVLSNFYPPDVIGGYELACAQAAGGLIGLGHEVRVLTAAPRQPVADDPDHVLRRLVLADEWSEAVMGDLAVTHLLTHAASRFVIAHNVHALTAELRDFEPDVVYAHSLVGVGGLGLMACLQYLNVPWVWQLGDSIPNRLCSSRRGPVIPSLAEQFSRQISGHYIVVSERVRTEVLASGIALNGRVDVIPNWITGERPPSRRQTYQGGRLRIISAGQVNRDKGVDVLIEAAALLRDSGADFSVDIYGRPADPSFAALVHSLRLERHVCLRGLRPHAEITRLYESYDILAFPTQQREPFGLVALEAAARGCVPLITRDCGVAEWLVHGAHCLKCERSPEDLAGALRSVIDGRTPLAHIARRGAEAVWRDFHLDAVLPALERALARAAVAGRGRGRGGPAAAAEAYRLARLAEQLTEGLIQEQVLACT